MVIWVFNFSSSKMMREIELSAEELVESLINLSELETVCLLDSCGVSNLGSHLLIAGICPVESFEITNDAADETLKFLDDRISNSRLAFIFSISYDFGLKLEKIRSRRKEFSTHKEPDVFLAGFDCLIVHDYKTGKTRLSGNQKRFEEIEKLLINRINVEYPAENLENRRATVKSNFTRENYIKTIEKIKERIRRGDTYQANLTQQMRAELTENQTAQQIFRRLRQSHPAAFAAFLKRNNDYVISISPERFFKFESGNSPLSQTISVSPIKGTRPRGKTLEEDLILKNELLNSQKDRAENTMIVDLLRNDIGKICRFGSVEVEKLCDLEIHPTLFHLVSTVKGELRENVNFTAIIKALFPCGSITGAPKISTMRIIDELETADRGLSMGAIGYAIQNEQFKIKNSFDLSVAIRTMVIRNREAIFNVGGGIVIDSIPEDEYEESLTKAKALLKALEADFPGL